MTLENLTPFAIAEAPTLVIRTRAIVRLIKSDANIGDVARNAAGATLHLLLEVRQVLERQRHG